jgi:hypothetical protein
VFAKFHKINYNKAESGSKKTKMGYHLKDIPKGKLGEFSKIVEEFEELREAQGRAGCEVLEICELCDLVGAIEAYAKRWNLSLEQLIKMKELTKSAFEEGKR